MVKKRYKKPVNVGEVHTIDITGLGHAGEGVGRIEGFAIFVPGAIPSDRVLVQIEENKKNHGRGKVLEVVEPAPGRITPKCTVADSCGGCQLQHMDYAEQLRWKRQLVVDGLTRIGKFVDPPVKSVLGMSEPYYYRNKAQSPVGKVDGRVTMGFYRRGTHALVPVKKCINIHPLCNKALGVMGRLLEEHGLVPYDEATHQGLVRHVIFRVSSARSELMVILVTNGPSIAEVDQLVDRMKAALPELVSVAQNINEERTNVILGDKTRVLWGRPYLIEELNGLEFAVSPRSFFQVNSKQAAVLCQQAAFYGQIRQGTRAVDCYCGTGSIALHLARDGADVVGIEAVPEAITDARLNAELNGLKSVDFRVGRVEVVLPDILQKSAVDVAFLDPPRKGCEPEVLDAIISANIPRLVYVSCNPSSLARDLSILAQGGYLLETVQPVDMFPHTSHVETVVLMSRVEK